MWQDTLISANGYKALSIRIFGAVPVSALVWYFSRNLGLRRFIYFTSAFFWLSYACFIAAIFIIYEPGPFGLTSSIGLGSFLILLFGVFTFSNLRIWASLLVGLLVLLVYTISVAFWTAADLVNFIMGDFLTAVAIVAGAATKTLFTERAQRRLFETSELLRESYNTVEQQVQERTAELQVTNTRLTAEITERKRAEDALLKNEAKQRAMIENIVDVIAIIDQDAINIYMSPNIERWFGWKPEDVIGKATGKIIHPDDLKRAQNVFDRLYEEVNSAITAECRFLCKDGSYKWIEFTAVNLLHEPDIAGVLLSFHDITERKYGEEERLRLEQQFHHAQKMESLGVLAGGIAHDFNNILTVILGHCYMAKSDYIPETEYKEVFLKIEAAGNRAADLCRQMLTYAGKTPLVQTRVNLRPLIDEVVKILQAAIKKHVSITLDLGCNVPEIKGDTGQIQQIIMNLIINAAEAIGDKNGTIRVVLSITVFEATQTGIDTFGTAILPGRYASIEVTDTGCGMDTETQVRIFEPFYTTKFTGRGLGMSAISGIIKSHEGILQLTSTPGVGTTFKIFFPVPKTSGDAETSSTTISLTEKTGGTILLVEDEETLRVMGKTMLDAMGFSAMTASNGSEALEIYRERGSEINVILLDLIMPVMGGIQAYHELRKISPAIPIIICSGYGVESVEDVIGNDPHAGFVHKPYKPDELRDVVVKMMG
jgi:PAS domain S-box-containing protein